MRRQKPLLASATSFNAQSPVPWPKRSLMFLKWSRSNMISEACSPLRAHSASARSARMVKWWRLQMPVSASVSAIFFSDSCTRLILNAQ